MTTQITEAAPSSKDSMRRNNYMAALSLAETIMSETLALPTNFDVNVYPWAPNSPELRFYFHHDVAGLRQFRDEQMLTESAKEREDGSIYIEAVREDVEGVRVVAWTLSDAKPSAVAA